MINQIYNAFKEAGLEREAEQLATTINGKVQSALGHYIALADSCVNKPGSIPGELATKSLNEIEKYIYNKLGPSLKKEVRRRLPNGWGFSK